MLIPEVSIGVPYFNTLQETVSINLSFVISSSLPVLGPVQTTLVHSCAEPN